MPEHTLRERILALGSSAPGAIEAFDAGEEGAAAPAEAVEAPQVIEEQRGLGVAAHDSVEGAKLSMLVAKLKAIAGKPKSSRIDAARAKLAAEIKAVKDIIAARAAEK